MALPNTKVEIAFDSGFTTPAASRTWVDVSAYVEGHLPITINRGRQDEVSQIPPSQLTLTLNNRDGRFSPELASGAYYPNVKLGRPIRVTSTYNAVAYVRFLGFIDEWAIAWPDGTSAHAVTNVRASSRTARLGRSAELRAIVSEEILPDGPIAYYRLNEPAGASSAVDFSGNQQRALTMTGTGAEVEFDGAGATFADGKHLAVADIPVAALPTGRTIEATLTTTTVPSVASQQFLTLWSPGTTGFAAAITNSGVIQAYLIDTGGAGSTNDGSVNVCDGAPHHIAATLTKSGGTTTASVYVDGALEASTSVGWATVETAAAGLRVGGGMLTVATKFQGSLSDAAVFDGALTAGQIQEHAGAATGFTGDLSGTRIERYAGYGAIPADSLDIDTGIATIGAVDTTGQTPISLMQKVAETENGVLYDAKDGLLTFRQRDARYNAASAFTLNATAQEIEADLDPKEDDQFVVNDVTASANGVAAGRVLDQASIDENGSYRKTLDSVTDDPADVLSGAQWMVGLGKEPRLRCSQVSVDVVNSSTSQAAAVLGAEIGTRFIVSNLPAQITSTADLFAEGYAEAITATTHMIRFNTSPAYGYAGTDGVFQLDVTPLDSTYHLAY